MRETKTQVPVVRLGPQTGPSTRDLRNSHELFTEMGVDFQRSRIIVSCIQPKIYKFDENGSEGSTLGLGPTM